MSRAELWNMLPKNPKKTLMVYKRLYPTLSGGAPTPAEVINIWKEVYGKYKNIKSFIKEVVHFIHSNQTIRTSEKIKEL